MTGKARVALTSLPWKNFIEEQLHSISATVMKLIFINNSQQSPQVLVKHEIIHAKFHNNFHIKYNLKNLEPVYSLEWSYLLSTINTETQKFLFSSFINLLAVADLQITFCILNCHTLFFEVGYRIKIFIQTMTTFRIYKTPAKQTKPLFLCETSKSWTTKCKAELAMHAWLLLFQSKFPIKIFSRIKKGRQLGTTQVTSFM